MNEGRGTTKECLKGFAFNRGRERVTGREGEPRSEENEEGCRRRPLKQRCRSVTSTLRPDAFLYSKRNLPAVRTKA